MLDIQFIRNNSQLVMEKSRQKGYEVDIQELLRIDTEKNALLKIVEELRSERNTIAQKMKHGKPEEALIAQGREIKDKLNNLEPQLKELEDLVEVQLKKVPNMPLADVPVGHSEEENVIAKVVGNKTIFNFTPKPHWDILQPRDMLDKQRAAKISGSRFAYLKGNLVQLQFAIVQFVMTTLADESVVSELIKENNLSLAIKPFTPVLPPAMLRTEPYVASARLDAANVTYRLADDDLWLNASAEHTLCTMYWNETLSEAHLPIRYIGYSTSFRREAGTYGKDTEGIIRMHQFDKLEMEIFSTPETGAEEHRLMVAIQEYLVNCLQIPYRLLKKCTFDIGKPNASGYDIECWFPGQNRYIETHTADFMTDYQARDLKVKVKRLSGDNDLVHTNDATAFALGRIMAAIVENYQQEDGSIIVPKVLIPFMQGKTTL